METEAVDFGGMGSSAAGNLFTAITDWMENFSADIVADANRFLPIFLGVFATFVAWWGLWVGVKAIKRAFQRTSN